MANGQTIEPSRSLSNRTGANFVISMPVLTIHCMISTKFWCIKTNHFFAMYYLVYRKKPLAMYVFTSDKDVIKEWKTRTTSGSLVFNECIMQIVGKTFQWCYSELKPEISSYKFLKI